MVEMAVDRNVITEGIAVHSPTANVHLDLVNVRLSDGAVGVHVTDPQRHRGGCIHRTGAPFTPETLTVISEPSQLTCPSCTVTVLPLKVVLVTLPQVVVEAPDMLVTSSEKVNTIFCRNVPPFPCRHSTPGSVISKSPEFPCSDPAPFRCYSQRSCKTLSLGRERYRGVTHPEPERSRRRRVWYDERSVLHKTS